MKKGKIIAAAVILCVCILAGILCRRMTANAIFDTSKAVSYEKFTSSHKIENSVLFIGTYLIHTQAMTDELYAKALDSAADSNQMNVYYKSELAGGAWFNITDAKGLSDISGKGILVKETELSLLWVTCYTGADGITKNAVNDEAVSIFDTPDPYYLYNLPELEPLRIQYENTFKSATKGVKAYYQETLENFFRRNLRNKVTYECDSQLEALRICYENFQKAGKKELAEIVSSIMGKIDARRRAEIFNQLVIQENNELERLQRSCAGNYYKETGFLS